MMDNLRAHHTEEVRAEIQKGGHQVLFRPPYSPDFAPIELAFSKIKAYIRSHKYEITSENLEMFIFHAILTITPADCKSWFEACFYY
jgi:transposase